MDELRSRNLAARTPEGRWYLTPQGMLLSNSIITDLQIIQDESQPLAKKR
jgi:hypothetical protein